METKTLLPEAGVKAQEYLYTGRVETSGGMLNLRDAPGGAVIGRLAPGDEVRVLSDEGEWAQIACEAAQGWAAKRYVVFVQARQDARMVITDETGQAFACGESCMIRIASGPID